MALELFRPCIDLHEGKVKQVVGSTLHDTSAVVENFVADKSPAHYAALFCNAGLTGGHVVMLGAGNQAACRDVLMQWPQGFDVGGGMTLDKARHWLNLGAKRIIFTSYLFSEDGLRLDKKKLQLLGENLPREQVVIDLSARKIEGEYQVMTKQWKVTSDVGLTPALFSYLHKYASGFLVHATDREGKKLGVDTRLVELLGKVGKERGIEVVYAGGVSTLQDVQALLNQGKEKLPFTVGSALDIYGGNIALDDLFHLLRAR